MRCIPLIVACICEKTNENFDKCCKYIEIEENYLPETWYVSTETTGAIMNES